tara:strand:+ start:234 stop:812 length:579 start_codon:yes stop_codon:yes gene_type:complete
MIHTVFNTNFYSLITPPNKDEIVKILSKIECDEELTKKLKWNESCKVKVEVIDKQETAKVILNALEIFFNDLEYISFIENLFISSAWRNTYYKDYYQELHDHYDVDGSDLSGVVFLNDYEEGASQFYFYNKYRSELSTSWLKLFNTTGFQYRNAAIRPKAGDVLLFPSYLLHGVTPHKLDNPRQTVSFNLSF